MVMCGLGAKSIATFNCALYSSFLFRHMRFATKNPLHRTQSIWVRVNPSWVFTNSWLWIKEIKEICQWHSFPPPYHSCSNNRMSYMLPTPSRYLQLCDTCSQHALRNGGPKVPALNRVIDNICRRNVALHLYAVKPPRSIQKIYITVGRYIYRSGAQIDINASIYTQPPPHHIVSANC